MEGHGILREETIKEVDEMFDLGGAFDSAGCGLILLIFIALPLIVAALVKLLS